MKKKLFCMLLAGCMLFAAGCGGGGSSASVPGSDSSGSDGGNSSSGPAMEETPTPDVEGGVHEYDIQPTGEYIVENGRNTGYSILLPEGADGDLELAASELQSFISEATGVRLDTVTAEEADGKYISLGNTGLAAAADVEAGEDLGENGFIIETVDDDVFIVGGSDTGTLYGAYSYLERELGFDYFHIDVYTLTYTDTLPLNDYHVKDIPDISLHMPGYLYLENNSQAMKRMRYNSNYDVFIPVGGNMWHNSFSYFPKSAYEATHPDIYSEDGTQLCYTAHGNEEEYEWMVETAFEVARDAFIAYPDRYLISLSIEDTMTSCTCPTCAAEKAKYGADSAAVVKFLNRIAARIDEWMAGTGAEYARDYRLLFFAYHQTNAAPAVYDEATDTFRPYDDEVVLADHVAPYFAETNGDYTQNFYDEGTANTQIAYNMRAWAAISKYLYFWSYGTNFAQFLTPYNSFNAVQDIYKFAFECGTDYMYTQGQANQPGGATGFSYLKVYLESKFRWDVNADAEALTDKFFDAMYGDASDIVRGVYDEYRVLATYQTDKLGYSGSRSIQIDAVEQTYWPRSLLASWISRLYEAIDMLEPLSASDPNHYAILVENIESELVAFLYLYSELYANQTEVSVLNNYRTECKRIIEKLGITRVSERGSLVTDLFASWGI